MRLTNNIKTPVIFIGTGRCGLTIISEIIMKHPELGYFSNYQKWFSNVPEVNMMRYIFQNRFWEIHGQKKQISKTKLINKFLFYPVENYKVWNEITSSDVDFSRAFLLGVKASADDKKKIRGYIDKLLKFQGRRRLALKFTGPSRLSYLLSVFPNAIFVNVVRNELSTIKSFLDVPFWKHRGRKQLWWKGAYTRREIQLAEKHKTNPVFLTGFQIKKLRQVTTWEIENYQVPVINIKYEDFIKEPVAEIGKILTFVGLEKKSESCYNYLKQLHIKDRNISKEDTVFSEEDIKLLDAIELDKIELQKN